MLISGVNPHKSYLNGILHFLRVKAATAFSAS